MRCKLAFFRNDFGFGGNNGLTDFKDILGFNVQSDCDAGGAVLALGDRAGARLSLAKAIVSSKYGKALIAVRDAESRVRFLGYRVENYKLLVFVVSAVMAGIAGALYVPQVGIINPGEFDPGNSIEAVIWVAVGGRGTLVGAALGAIAGQFRQDLFHRRLPDIWLFASAACSSSSRCSCRRASSAWARRAARRQRAAGRPTTAPPPRRGRTRESPSQIPT